MKKRLFAFILMLALPLFAFTSCYPTNNEVDYDYDSSEETYDDGCDDGYQGGFDDGFDEGYSQALEDYGIYE